MKDIRMKEMKLFNEIQEMKYFRNNEKIKKKKSIEIEEKRQKIIKKQNFFHNYILAYDKVRKGEN